MPGSSKWSLFIRFPLHIYASFVYASSLQKCINKHMKSCTKTAELDCGKQAHFRGEIIVISRNLLGFPHISSVCLILCFTQMSLSLRCCSDSLHRYSSHTASRDGSQHSAHRYSSLPWVAFCALLRGSVCSSWCSFVTRVKRRCWKCRPSTWMCSVTNFLSFARNFISQASRREVTSDVCLKTKCFCVSFNTRP